MKANKYWLWDGEEIVLYETEDGFFLCPVCGGKLGEEPYSESEEPGSAEIYAWPSQRVCYFCQTQFDNDDLPDRPRGESIQQKWGDLRRNWFWQAENRVAARKQLAAIRMEMPPQIE